MSATTARHPHAVSATQKVWLSVSIAAALGASIAFVVAAAQIGPHNSRAEFLWSTVGWGLCALYWANPFHPDGRRRWLRRLRLLFVGVLVCLCVANVVELMRMR
jgi:hypothetical protein